MRCGDFGVFLPRGVFSGGVGQNICVHVCVIVVTVIEQEKDPFAVVVCSPE